MIEVQEYVKRLNAGIVESPELQMFRRLRPAKFYELCKLRLSFLIDVPSEFIYGDHSNDANSFTKSFFSGSNKIQAKMFEESGVCDRIVDNLMKLIHYLEQESCINTEGIFRKSGNLSRQRELKNLVLQGHDISPILQQPIDEKCNSYSYTVHDIAGALKNLLADLMQPILTLELLDYFLKAANLCSMACNNASTDQNEKYDPSYSIKKGKQINSIRLLLFLLPQQNRDILRQLFILLHKVSLNQTNNRMTSESLGTLFGPLLLTKKKITSKELKNNFGILNQLATYMIEGEESLFLIPKSLADDVSNYSRKLLRPQFQQISPNITLNNRNSSVSLRFHRAKSETSLNTFHRDSRNNDDTEFIHEEPDLEELGACINFTAQRLSHSDDVNEINPNSSCSLSIEAINLESPAIDSSSNHDATKFAVAELYAQVQALPESNDKRKWIQKFNLHNGGITPCRYPKKVKRASNSDLHHSTTVLNDKGQEKKSWLNDTPKLVGTFNGRQQGTCHGIRSSLRKRLALRSHLQIVPLTVAPTKCSSKASSTHSPLEIGCIPNRSHFSARNPISPNSNSTDSTSSCSSSLCENKVLSTSSSCDIIPFVDLLKLHCPDEKEELDLSPDNKSSRCSPFKRGWKSRLNLLPSSPILTNIKSTSQKCSINRGKNASQSQLITSPRCIDFCDSATCSLTPKVRKLDSPYPLGKPKFSVFRKKLTICSIQSPGKS